MSGARCTYGQCQEKLKKAMRTTQGKVAQSGAKGTTAASGLGWLFNLCCPIGVTATFSAVFCLAVSLFEWNRVTTQYDLEDRVTRLEGVKGERLLPSMSDDLELGRDGGVAAPLGHNNITSLTSPLGDNDGSSSAHFVRLPDPDVVVVRSAPSSPRCG